MSTGSASIFCCGRKLERILPTVATIAPKITVEEIKATENQIRQQWHEKRQSSKNYLIDNISDEMAQYMKEKRLGKQ